MILVSLKHTLKLSNSRWPGELLTTDYVKEYLIDALAPMATLINHYSEPILLTSLFFGDRASDFHHVPK